MKSKICIAKVVFVSCPPTDSIPLGARPCRNHPEIPLLVGYMPFCWYTTLHNSKEKNICSDLNFKCLLFAFTYVSSLQVLNESKHTHSCCLSILMTKHFLKTPMNKQTKVNSNLQGHYLPSKRTRGLSKNISLQEVNGSILVQLRPQTRRQAKRQISGSLRSSETQTH